MKKFRVSHPARADLDEIWLHISKDGLSAADAIIDHFKERFALLAQSPELGELREDLAVDLRQSIVGNYVVLYRINEGIVEIERVIHGSRDVPKEYRRRLFGR